MTYTLGGELKRSRLTQDRAAARARIRIEELTSPSAPAFKALYALYKSIFPMADEREPPEAFSEILEINRALSTQEHFGPYREIVAIVRLWEGGPIIGGHIFGVTTSPDHFASGIPASVQAIYTFMHKDYRGLVPIEAFAKYCQRAAVETFPVPGITLRLPVIFFEVNNPLKMTPEEISMDTCRSGLDPHRRYNFWLRSGFRPLDFPYVQPRLRPDVEPVRCLDLFCSGDINDVSATLLLSHLRAFVSVSVLKNQDACRDPDFLTMQDWLTRYDAVPLVPRSRSDISTIAQRATLARGMRDPCSDGC